MPARPLDGFFILCSLFDIAVSIRRIISRDVNPIEVLYFLIVIGYLIGCRETATVTDSGSTFPVENCIIVASQNFATLQ